MMTPLSGSPNKLTVIHTGKVSARASAKNSHEARNLPTIACQVVTGNVNNSSIVPKRRSSAHSRIPAAGTKNRYSQGCHVKKETSEASPRSKKLPTVKVKNPVSSKKMTRKTYATGEVK